MKHTFTFTFTLFVITLCTIFLLSGCGQKLPDGMPKLYFCEITLTQENVPLAEAEIIFVSSDETYPWMVTGQTDSSGKALMFTNGNYEGVPEGEFIVRVNKKRSERGKRINPNDKYSDFTAPHEIHFVEKQYRESTTSPLKAKVEKGKNRLSFDVGKAVEESIIPPRL